MALCLVSGFVMFSVLPAQANHPVGACLDLAPETETKPVGTVQVVTATLRTPGAPTQTSPSPCDDSETAVNATSTVTISFEITGSNDPDDPDSNSPETPDKTCLILTNTSSCSINLPGNTTGTDTVRGWIDHDASTPGQGGVTEADLAEGQNELTTPGTGCTGLGPTESAPEPDCTDVVSKTWSHGAPDSLDCDDPNGPDTERETNPHAAGAQSNETYTCRILDEFGNQTTDTAVTVNGEHKDGVNDPEDPDSVSYESPDHSCVTATSGTNNRGQCTITVTQADADLGTTQICFWIESYTFGTNPPVNNSGAALCGNEVTDESQSPPGGGDTPNDEADQVEKTWEQRRTAGLDAEPETKVNNINTDHTITATVYDQFGGTFAGTTNVRFEFFQGSPKDTDGNSPNSPDLNCTTNNSSSCSVTYRSGSPGVDRLCVFINSAPFMSGDNTNGTCDGEGLAESDDDPAVADPPLPAEDDVDVVEKRWVDPASPSPSPSASTSQSPSPSPSPSVSRSPSPSPSPSTSRSPSPSPSPTPKPQCSDGVDNDGDGRTDYPADPGCTSSTDTSESPDPFVPKTCRDRGPNENVMVGTSGDDVMTGTPGRDVICGDAGDDVINSRGGNDLVVGNGGNDRIGAGGGKDKASGNGGRDDLFGKGGNDDLNGNDGRDDLNGGAGDDNLDGGRDRDQCVGGKGDDVVRNCE